MASSSATDDHFFSSLLGSSFAQETSVEVYQQEIQKVLHFLQVDMNDLSAANPTQKLQDNAPMREMQETARHPLETDHFEDEKMRQLNPSEPRICNECGTTITPLWRRGENHLLLCNKCGLRQKRKLCSIKKAAASAAKRVKYDSNELLPNFQHDAL